MKIFLFCLFGWLGSVLCISAYAQKITLNEQNGDLKEVLSRIKAQTTYNFLYNNQVINNALPVTIQVHNQEFLTVLATLFSMQPITYAVHGRVVVLSRKSAAVASRDRQPGTFTLQVLAADTREPVAGAVIRNGGKDLGNTNEAGILAFIAPANGQTLEVSHIGYQLQQTTIQDAVNTTLLLEPVYEELAEVLVTGIVERKRYSFTGATNTLSGQELKAISNQNIIASLRTLDPSFILVDNNLRGGDPNALAQIELRGKTSIPNDQLQNQFGIDPNLPLFILDGFESSLEQISELDINRIASVTLLKDAASTALYGARSANGVVVVETIKPQSGKLQLFYNGDFNIEIADLSDYNMMNAAEKLEFERLSGRYTSTGDPALGIGGDQVALDRLYNNRLRNVLRGVDTYWLADPLRIGFSHNQSLYVNTGNNAWQFGLGANHKAINGVMKGSGRTSWNARADVTYRHNQININNSMFINGYDSHNSPTNIFSAYVSQNPYYEKANTEPYLEATPLTGDFIGTYQVPNHIYNAGLNSYQQGRSTAFQNNLGAAWDINKHWRLSGSLQLVGAKEDMETFISPSDTRFELLHETERGQYNLNRQIRYAYQGNIMLTRHTIFKEKHILTTNIRAELQENNINLKGYEVRGFPPDVSGDASLSYNSVPDRLPTLTSPPAIRRVNALASTNYVYNYRYFIDATYRIDGSTQFGSANRYSAFWSAGLGWNLNRESFMNRFRQLDLFRLRVNTGLTGNQSFGSFASTVAYIQEADSNEFGGGLFHRALGNPNLRWQKTRQTNIGLDLELFRQRFSATINIYEKYTSPLIVPIDLPGSNGVTDYPMNVGNLRVRGLETIVRYSPVYRPEQRIIWTLGLTSTIYTSRYEGLNNLLNSLNEEQRLNNSLIRFKDGYGPDDLWAVRSAGIDPVTGREVFLKADGAYTFTYDVNDIVVAGSARPQTEGVISSFLTIKSFSLGLYMRYSIGRSRLNEALYNKVENITFDDLSSNQDRRALYDRWREPGSNARFKGISLTETTPISSRFIQRENIFTGESLSLSYELEASRFQWLRQARVQRLRFTGYTNNLIRFSTIIAERGTEYPFTRSTSFSISAMF